MSGFGSLEAVVAAIREDARADVERIARDAEAAVARLRREDAAVPVVVPDADARVAAARREARARIAEEDWADRQSALTVREEWIAGVAAAAIRRLQERPADERRADVCLLAAEALDHLGSNECELLVSPADAPILDEAWCRALRRDTGRGVRVVAAHEVEGGCIARTLDQRLRFDNTYAARARRFEAEWRQALGALFDRLMHVHA